MTYGLLHLSAFPDCGNVLIEITLNKPPKDKINLHVKLASRAFVKDFLEHPQERSQVKIVSFKTTLSGNSKPMVCQTYDLHASRVSQKRRKSRKRRERLRQLQTRS